MADPADNTGTLFVARARDVFNDRLRTYKVIVDEVEAARVKVGGSAHVPLPAGAHLVAVRLDRFYRSPTMTIEIFASQTTTLLCSPPGGTAEAMWSTFHPKSYVRIAVIPPA